MTIQFDFDIDAVAAAVHNSCVSAKLVTTMARQEARQTKTTDMVRDRTASKTSRVVDSVMLTEMQKELAAIRSSMYRSITALGVTVPDGQLIAITSFDRLQHDFDHAKARWDIAVATHTTPWHTYREAVAQQMGAHWEEDLLPHTQAEYAAKFSFQLRVATPQVGALMVQTTDPDLRATLAASIEEGFAAYVRTAAVDVYTTLAKMLADVAEGIEANVNKGKPKAIYPRGMRYVALVAHHARAYNFADDERLITLASACEGIAAKHPGGVDIPTGQELRTVFLRVAVEMETKAEGMRDA